MTLNKNQSIAIHTGIIVFPFTIATGVLSDHFFHLPILSTCMITSFILTAITLPTLHHFEQLEQPRIVFDGDDVQWGEHRWRRSDVEGPMLTLIAASGAAGITMHDIGAMMRKEMISVDSVDYEAPMAMYPEIKE